MTIRKPDGLVFGRSLYLINEGITGHSKSGQIVGGDVNGQPI
jgi:hypothetical protein